MRKITKISLLDGLLIATIYWGLPKILEQHVAALVTIAAVFAIFIFSKRWISPKTNKKELKEIFILLFVSIILQWVWGLLIKYSLKLDTVSTNQNNIVDSLKNGGWKTYFFIFMLLIWAPIVEELVFRGFIQEYVGKINKKIGFFISWLTFAFIHIGPSLMSGASILNLVIQFFPYGVMSFLFCYYYYKHEDIGKNITFHFFNNLIATIIIFIQ